MAIDPKTITTELTIELDEDEISIADFSNAFEHFFGLVREVTKSVTPNKKSNAWVVQVYPGSAGIGVNPQRAVYLESEINAIRQNCLDGLRQLENGQRASFFTDKAIEHSRELAKLFHAKKAPPNIRIWSRQEAHYPIVKKIAERAGEILDAAYEDFGSVEGTLEKLSAHDAFEFVIYDSLTNQAIKCEVEESKIQDAWSAFRKRVEVIGKVHYRKDGKPVSVKAKEIIEFPDADGIPSLEEIRSILS